MIKVIILFLWLFIQSSKADEIFSKPNNKYLTGPNVCTEISRKNVTIFTTEIIEYQVTTHIWCAAFPPRCNDTKNKTKAVNTTKVVEKLVEIRFCCPNYKEVNDSCVPDCEKTSNDQCSCKYGSYQEDESCTCDAGWTGKFCDELCPYGTWGINCANLCKCRNKSKCRKYDGRCVCELGMKYV